MTDKGYLDPEEFHAQHHSTLNIPYQHYNYVATAATETSSSHHPPPQAGAAAHSRAMSLDRAYVNTLSGSSRGPSHASSFDITGVAVQGRKYPLQAAVRVLLL